MTPSMSIDCKRKNMEKLRTIMNESSNAFLSPDNTTGIRHIKTQKLASICKAKAKHEPESNTMAQTMQVLES